MTRAAARPGRLAGSVAAFALLVGLAACGDDSGGDSAAAGDGNTTSETTAPDETTTTTLSLREEVLAAHEASTRAVADAFDPPNPQHPDLLATYSGRALTRLQAFLADYKRRGVSEVAIESDIDAQVTALDETSATLEVCIRETTEIIDTETRVRREGPIDRSGLSERQMERIDGTWKIVSGQQKDRPC